MTWKSQFPENSRYFESKNGILFCGNCLEILKQFPDESVDCVVTSPPYWNARDYGKETEVDFGDWKGQLGLEPDFNLYIKHLLIIFDEVWRVLKPTGTLWVNIADVYNGSGKAGKNPEYQERHTEFGKHSRHKERFGLPTNVKNCPRKSLCLIPERFTIEMVNRGWILRNKIVWYKTNGIPESVKDRFTEKLCEKALLFRAGMNRTA